MGCASCNGEKQAIFNDIRRYKGQIIAKVKAHKFDNGNNSFASKICKENSLTDMNIALAWIELYKSFMICLAWQMEPEKGKKIKKTTPDRNKYLCLPYEILQVWRLHILYSKNYFDFCGVITEGRSKSIDFIPPLQVWKFTDITAVQKSFNQNKEFIEVVTELPKSDIKALFVFQSSYYKNTLSFNLLDNSPTFNLIVSRMEEEFKKTGGGVFSIQTRDINSLKTVSEALDKLIFLCIPQEMLSPPNDWQIGQNIPTADRNKGVNFQNIQLPQNFAFFFARHHLISIQRANIYIDEYKKFLYLSHVTKLEQTPSEEVDQVWHYHITYLEDYKSFSSQKMGTEFFHHNPADGTTEDDVKYRGVYESTKSGLMSFFGHINQYAWPSAQVRFSQSYKWFSHPDFIRKTSVWNSVKTQKQNSVVRTVYLGGGCYVGCGYYRGMYGCTFFIGCGGIGYGCGFGYSHYGCGIGHGYGCAAAYSGCGGFGGCGGSSCGGMSSCGGVSSCGGSSCGGASSCGGGGKLIYLNI